MRCRTARIRRPGQTGPDHHSKIRWIMELASPEPADRDVNFMIGAVWGARSWGGRSGGARFGGRGSGSVGGTDGGGAEDDVAGRVGAVRDQGLPGRDPADR